MTSPDLPARLREALADAGFTYDGVAEALGAAGARRAGPQRDGARAAAYGRAAAPLETLVRLFLLQAPVAVAGRRARAARLWSTSCRPRASSSTRSARWWRASTSARTPPGDRDLWVVSDLTPGLDGSPNRVGADHVLGISPASTSLAQLDGPRAGGPVARPRHRLRRPGPAPRRPQRRRSSPPTSTPGRCGSPGSTPALNGVANVDVRDGSLFEPVAGERFDLIATNPPFVISPATGERLVYRDSGLPGDRRRRAHRPQPRRTTSPTGGWCQVLTNWVIARGVPVGRAARRLARPTTATRSSCSARCSTPRRTSSCGSRTPGLHGAHDYLDRYDAWLSWFDEQGVEAIGFGWVNLRRRRQRGGARTGSWTGRTPSSSRSPRRSPPGAPPSTLEVGPEDLPGTPRGRAPGDRRRPRAPRTRRRVVLRQQRGLMRARQADTVEAALVGACDGDLTRRPDPRRARPAARPRRRRAARDVPARGARAGRGGLPARPERWDPLAAQAELVALRVGQHVPRTRSPWPTSTGRAPSASRRSSSAAWSPSTGSMSKCSRFFVVFGPSGTHRKSSSNAPAGRRLRARRRPDRARVCWKPVSRIRQPSTSAQKPASACGSRGVDRYRDRSCSSSLHHGRGRAYSAMGDRRTGGVTTARSKAKAADPPPNRKSLLDDVNRRILGVLAEDPRISTDRARPPGRALRTQRARAGDRP